MSTVGWIVLGVAVWVAVFIGKRYLAYKQLGLGDGRKFGNQIADAIGLEHNLFHEIFDKGDTPAPTLMMLKAMQASGVSPMDSAIDIAPFLVDGLHKLEATWGSVPQLEGAKPKLHRLQGMYEEKYRGN